MNPPIAVSGTAAGNLHSSAYRHFLEQIQARFDAQISQGSEPLFTTDTSDLFDTYLATFEDHQERQSHRCHCCRDFINHFGGLVTIDQQGRTSPLFWDDAQHDGVEKTGIAALARQVKQARITGVFFSSLPVWGKPLTGIWSHMSITPPAALLHQGVLKNAAQFMAEKREDFKTVQYALQQYSLANIEQALTLLQTDSLYRSEKVLGPTEWLHRLQQACTNAKGELKNNLVWRAIATAPAGFCHPRSSMTGTLLDDIAAGMDFGEVSRRFAEKMHPLQYLRPQAAPSAGAIAAAEKVFAQLNAAGALARRFARLEDIHALWQPKAVDAPEKPVAQATAAGGLFSHLLPKAKATVAGLTIPPQVMTWEKFQRTVLPNAERIEIFCPERKDNYTTLVTAVNPDAPPILQWDNPEQRNPVSTYVWHGGCAPAQFGLKGDQYHEVSAITLRPSMWYTQLEHQGDSVIFLIRNAKESRNPGGALFPENLRSEFHGIRSVVEAWSQKATMEGMDEASAAGISLDKGGNWDARLRVWSGGKSLDYKLDRWD